MSILNAAAKKEVANAYYTYENITQKHPFNGGIADILNNGLSGSHLGQQCGFFHPLANLVVKEANEKAVLWHQNSNHTE